MGGILIDVIGYDKACLVVILLQVIIVSHKALNRFLKNFFFQTFQLVIVLIRAVYRYKPRKFIE